MIVVSDVAANPMNVGLLSAIRVVIQSDLIANLIEQLSRMRFHTTRQ